MTLEHIKNNWKIGLMAVLGILINIIASMIYEPRLIITGLSIISILATYIMTLIYLDQFNFPLFFVRDELNYWGGLFGGLSGGIGYTIGYMIIFSYDIVFVEIISGMMLAFCTMFLLILSLTATLITDIKNTDYIDIKK